MSVTVRSNLASVITSIRDVAGCLKMHAVGRYGQVGDDALDIIAEGIYDRTVLGQQEPGGADLAPLAPATLRRKEKLGYPSTIGVEKGLMLDADQLKGERSITSEAASMEYGKTELAKLEAQWFQDPNRAHGKQPRRPFFELDERIEQDLDNFVDEVVGNAIERNGGA